MTVVAATVANRALGIAKERRGMQDTDSSNPVEDEQVARQGSRQSSRRGEVSKYQWIADACRQDQVRKAYQLPSVQWFIAALIMGNFITNIIEKQIDPLNVHFPATWPPVEAVWNIIFIFELLWNMYGSWYLSQWRGHFLSSGWNLFDFLVVGVSIPSLTGADLGSFSLMRMFRAFRVFRLFKRIKSLNNIITALGRAVPGIVNAAIVQLLVMCIYAILAVDLFGEMHADGTYVNANNDTIPSVTQRGFTYGDEYYGTFFRSLFTLFQVLTGESWAEAVARPIVFMDGAWPYIGGLYFVSYVLLCGIVLVNVAVAVLLEKMVDPGLGQEEDGVKLSELPPKAAQVFAALDTDGDGIISSTELTRAAELMKKDVFEKQKQAEAEGGGLTQDAAMAAAHMLAEATKADIRTQVEATQRSLAEMRSENMARETRLLEELKAAEERERLLQESLISLGKTMERLTVAATRGRRRPPANGTKAGNGEGATNGGTRSDDDERMVQDGERLPNKAAPERMVQRL